MVQELLYSGVLVSALVLLVILALGSCGQKSADTQRLATPITPLATPDSTAGEGLPQERAGEDNPFPLVAELDELIAGAPKGVRAGSQVISFGSDYSPEGSGSTSDREYSIEVEGTELHLRAYEPGEYTYALFAQTVGDGEWGGGQDDDVPLQSLIDCTVCLWGGGRDEEIPLVYYVGLADYSMGSWRWFGPFSEVDVMITVNSEVLKSRFKSPHDNYYLMVATTNGSKATSSLPEDGYLTSLPFEPVTHTVSGDVEDPGGVKIEEVVTWVAEYLLTDPAIVTGLWASGDTEGVSLGWDTNPDPDVDIYQVFRGDLDDEDPRTLIQGVFAPQVEYLDGEGIPGKEYLYLVRARNPVGYGGFAYVLATRPVPPT